MQEITRFQNRAFTLVEVCIMTAVIGLLAALCIPAIGNSISQSKLQQAITHARVLESAKDSYKMSHPFSSGTITSDKLAKYLPQGYTVADKTPWNTAFDNTLNLDAPVSFSHNGKTYYSNKSVSQ